MTPKEKAIGLDNLLNKFDGQHNFTRTWEECKSFTDISPLYGHIENMLMQLLGEGKLKGLPDNIVMPHTMIITQKGWASMTDYKNTGYYVRYKKEKAKETYSIVILTATIATLIIVTIQTYREFHPIQQSQPPQTKQTIPIPSKDTGNTGK